MMFFEFLFASSDKYKCFEKYVEDGKTIFVGFYPDILNKGDVFLNNWCGSFGTHWVYLYPSKAIMLTPVTLKILEDEYAVFERSERFYIERKDPVCSDYWGPVSKYLQLLQNLYFQR